MHYVSLIIETIFRVTLLREIGGKRTFDLAREMGRIWRCFCWEKGNLITINEFKYR